MNKLDWAKKEIEIVCGKNDSYEFEYDRACYASALKAFESLCEDEHSGFSIQFARHILDRLIEGKPLTPIKDTDDIWNAVNLLESDERPDVVMYQCKRMSSLFKDVHSDGHVEYRDINRIVCINIDTGDDFKSCLVNQIINEDFPITMPYMPGKSILVKCKSFAYNSDYNTIYDTFGVYDALFTEDGIQKSLPINRFFKEVMNEWVEITKDEYNNRKNNI